MQPASAPHDPPLRPRPGRRRHGVSVQTKMLLVLLPLLALIGALLAYATRQAGQIHRDLARLTEEDREAELTQSLLVELRGAEAWARRPVTAAHRDAIEADLDQHLALARMVVERLQASGYDDPSDPEHELREHEMRAALRATLDRVEDRARTETDWLPLADDLGRARREVEVLAAETRQEATHVAGHLDRSVQRLVDMLFLVAAVGGATLFALGWTFRRVVLRPLRSIERATLQLGRENPGATVADSRPQRAEVASDDEFGQLAATFNEMAARIETDREELERRVEERTREVLRTARLAELGTLAAGIAHEINNPLASIAAGVEGLKRELGADLAPASGEFLELVLEETARARDIAKRLLRLGRQDPARREPVWLAQEAQEVAAMVGHLARRRDIDVEVDFAADLPPIVSDPGEWRQVLYNLLRNAIDAAPPASVVRVLGRVDAGCLVIRVRDQGPGFPVDDLDRVFEPFFTTKAPGEGTGLGLTIVDRIVRECGGRVQAGNHDGGGEIVVHIPLPPAGDPA